MRAERRFIARFLLLVGFASGLAIGAGTSCPWWAYVALVIALIVVILACTIYDIRSEP